DRGDLPGDAPLVPAPAALALLAAIADDRVPVAVGLLLVRGRHLEGEGLAVPERGAAVDADARNAEDGEVDGEHVPLPAGREVARRAVDGVDGRVGEGGRVEARRFLRVMVVPEADGVRGMPGHGLLLGDDRGRLLAPRRKKDACPRPPSRTWACGAPPSSASRSPPRCRGAPR